MTDNSNSENGDATASAGQPAQINVLGQYVKDLSFENPNAPKSLQGPGESPNLKVEVNVNVAQLETEIYESEIQFTATATNSDGTLYHLELVYAAAFRLTNIPETALKPILLINCPTLLFPFVRRMISDLTREGGFPPLLLDPIDFSSLYDQNKDRIENLADGSVDGDGKEAPDDAAGS